ncbi:class I heat shock protein [Sesamum angolense]|uniref:Class I heat shock protein n=1 Tax=Sesamum angolense TaxID=2727404 RepID=A0AAE2C221_9LAMI|nr:class I heat shock protein [Sesamum angolense]
MSLIPCFFGTRRSNVFDPLSLDIWDPFERCPFLNTVANLPSSARNHRLRRRSRGLEGDAGGPRVQGGRSWAEERGSEGGGRGRKSFADKRGEKPGVTGGEEREMAPRGEEQREVPPPV